jgi:transposase
VQVDGLTVTEVADKFGVSRQTVHEWLRRYEQGGLAALDDRPHRPVSCPHQMPAAVEARVCELRRQHPFWGPVRIAYQLGRDGVEVVPSRMGIWRALVRHGLIEPNLERSGAQETSPDRLTESDPRVSTNTRYPSVNHQPLLDTGSDWLLDPCFGACPAYRL